MRTRLIVTIVMAMAAGSASAESTAPADDAAALYFRAAALLRADDAKNIMSPGASNDRFHEYPPMSEQWVRMEKQDYDRHAQVRQWVRQAAAIDHAAWPDAVQAPWDYRSELRNVTEEIADAAEYQSLILKDQPQAFRTAGDLLHMADLLKNQPNESLVRLLVAEGIEVTDVARLMLIQANAPITEDPQNTHDLPISIAKQWIARLLDHPDARAEIDQAMKWELSETSAATRRIAQASMDPVLETTRRVLTERDLAAMALAAHVYRHEHGRWPENLNELSTELPRVPLDPWGDGKQTLGYVLIKGLHSPAVAGWPLVNFGMPDGGDRPLVYSRDHSKDGLFFRTDEPAYSYYGYIRLSGRRRQGGQFLDVAGWAPPAGKKVRPTTQPLPN